MNELVNEWMNERSCDVSFRDKTFGFISGKYNCWTWELLTKPTLSETLVVVITHAQFSVLLSWHSWVFTEEISCKNTEGILQEDDKPIDLAELHSLFPHGARDKLKVALCCLMTSLTVLYSPGLKNGSLLRRGAPVLLRFINFEMDCFSFYISISVELARWRCLWENANLAVLRVVYLDEGIPATV